MENLHDIACARIASFMMEKNSADEVAKKFTIQCQLSVDEGVKLESIYKDNF